MPASQPLPWAFHWEAEVQPRGLGARGASCPARPRIARPMCGANRMEEMGEGGTMRAARPQGRAHQGRPGSDDMRVDALPDVWKAPGRAMQAQCLQGPEPPRAIQRGECPKPGRQEQRQRGLPWVMERVLQQARLQGLQGRWAPTCSACSDGVRPGRAAPQAVAQAPASLAPGDRSVVASAWAPLFDRVCQDRLRRPRAPRSTEKRVLTLLRAWRHAGIVADGRMPIPAEGTPPGSPCAPFLANVVWDAVDKARANRGHR